MKNSKIKIINCISAVALLFACSTNAIAQEAVAIKHAEFGIRFMPTFSKFDLKTSTGGTVKGQAKLGYGVGAFLGYNFSNHVGVQAEIMYSTNTQKYSEESIQRKVTLKYFNIPLLLSLNTGKMKPVNLNVVGGPQIGISAGSNVTTSGTNDGSTPSNAVVNIKKGDLGIAYGFGIDFALNEARTFRLGLGYRGVYGLFDISNDSQTTSTDSFYVIDKTHVKSSAFYAGLSVLF